MITVSPNNNDDTKNIEYKMQMAASKKDNLLFTIGNYKIRPIRLIPKVSIIGESKTGVNMQPLKANQDSLFYYEGNNADNLDLSITDMEFLGGKSAFVMDNFAYLKFNNVSFDYQEDIGCKINKFVNVGFEDCKFNCNKNSKGLVAGGKFADNLRVYGCGFGGGKTQIEYLGSESLGTINIQGNNFFWCNEKFISITGSRGGKIDANWFESHPEGVNTCIEFNDNLKKPLGLGVTGNYFYKGNYGIYHEAGKGITLMSNFFYGQTKYAIYSTAKFSHHIREINNNFENVKKEIGYHKFGLIKHIRRKIC